MPSHSLPNPPPSRVIGRHAVVLGRAFTLVELLVVVGTIGLLLAILLPALSSVRRSAKSVTCVSQQREIARAMLGRAVDHDGYMPLAGTVAVPDVTPPNDGLAPLLNDSSRRRYDYLKSRTVSDPPTGEDVLPTELSLLKWLGEADVPARESEFMPWIEGGGLDRVQKLFNCPEVTDRGDPKPSTALKVGNSVRITLRSGTATDYGFNEAVLGFDHADAGVRRLRGKLSAVADASRTLLCGDMGSLPNVAFVMTWAPPPAAPPGAVTLADALPGGGPDGVSVKFDRERHRGKINLAFADGHVDSRAVTPDDLSDVVLSSR